MTEEELKTSKTDRNTDTQIVMQGKRRHHNNTPTTKKLQVQMALPVPAELAAGWL